MSNYKIARPEYSGLAEICLAHARRNSLRPDASGLRCNSLPATLIV